MSHRAFLRAIVSEPADDTARLVYADYLEETGEPAHIARAEFIRTQIQAHAIHPNDPRRGELEIHAAGLFASHWLDWWSPVCEAIGLPVPHVPTRSFAERLGRFFGRQQLTPGHPYKTTSTTTLGLITPRPLAPPDTLREVAFVRGFPQWVSLLGQLADVQMVIQRWTEAAPLASLYLHGTVGRDWRWIDGEHLHGVRELSLGHAAATAVTTIAGSRHLPRLNDLTLRPDHSNIDWPAEQYRAFAHSSLASRVRWLRVVIGSPAEAAALDGPHLANLTGLHIDPVPVDERDREDTARVANAVAQLLASPHLTGLKELTLPGVASLALAAVQAHLAAKIRRLIVNAPTFNTSLPSLLRADVFPDLTDLHVAAPPLQLREVYGALAESPLAGRLRHLRLAGEWPGVLSVEEELVRLVRALNPALETLALEHGVREVPEVYGELQARFPRKVRFL